MTEAEKFEAQLRQDLRRGHVDRPPITGREQGVFARWLKPDEMTGKLWSTDNGGLFLGRRGGRVIGWNDDRHVFVVAGNRSGKGRSFLINNLVLDPDRSALILDPKGELAKITAGRRGKGTAGGKEGMGQDVFVLDPFGVSGRPCSSFNPLRELNIQNEEVIDEAMALADAMIIPQKHDQHWTDSAKIVLRALILIVLRLDDFERNLLTVRDLLSLNHASITSMLVKLTSGDKKDATKEKGFIELLISENRHGDAAGAVCAAVGEQLKSMGDKELGGVLSTARTQTEWLNSPKLRFVLVDDHIEPEDRLKLENLKKKRTTVYLCLPATNMTTHARWFRLMVSLGVTVLERTPDVGRPQVLFVLEEFATLGHMENLSAAAGYIAGMGVKLITVIQNFGQLKEHYKDNWETFLGNSGVVIAFGNSDSTTLEILRRRLGSTSVIEQVPSSSGDGAAKDDKKDVPLLAEHEIQLAFARDKQAALIVTMDTSPAVVMRCNYDNKGDALFVGKYDDDPKFIKADA